MAAVTTLDPHVAEPQWGRVRWLGVALPGHLALRVWQRDLDVFLNLWKVNLFPPLAEPLIMILAMGLGLGSFVELTGDQEYIQFIAPGVMAVIPMFAGVGEALWGAFFRLEQQFTYQAILATPGARRGHHHRGGALGRHAHADQRHDDPGGHGGLDPSV